MLAAGEVVEALRYLQLVFDLLRHAGLVDRQRDDRGAKAACEPQSLVGGLFTILEIDRVDDRLAAVEFQRRFEHRVFGRVDDQRRVDRTAHPRHRLGHVGDFVPPDKGRAQIEGVRAFLDLLAPHLDAAVPIALVLQLAELARAVGIAAFADRQVGVLLPQVYLSIQRGDAGGPNRLSLSRQRPGPIPADAPQHRVERGDVRRLGAAAPADHIDPVLENKALEPLSDLGCAERVLGAAGDELGEPGVGLDRDIIGQFSPSHLTCSAISRGPVAQLRPIIGTSSAWMIVAAAAMSAPTSKVPVVSTVTWTMIGISFPAASRPCFAPFTAALICSGSWQVSMRMASTPPAISPAHCSASASSRSW